MNWLAIITTIFNYLWLTAVLVFLILIWRNSVKRTEKAQQALIDLAVRSADSAQKAAETAHILAAVLQKDHTQ